VLVPNPSYPIHIYGPVIAGAHIVSVPVHDQEIPRRSSKRPHPAHDAAPQGPHRQLPLEPHHGVCRPAFLARLVELAREHGFYLIQDLAYADIAFDGYKPPSVLEVPGAKDVAVEFFTLSKSYNMPGWRVGFMVGNPRLVAALAASRATSTTAPSRPSRSRHRRPRRPAGVRRRNCDNYRRRRDVLVEGLNKAGWP
jgi:alanine-synthesizing transaminase